MPVKTRRHRQLSPTRESRKYKSNLLPGGAFEMAKFNVLPTNPFKRRRADVWQGQGCALAYKPAVNSSKSSKRRVCETAGARSLGRFVGLMAWVQGVRKSRSSGLKSALPHARPCDRCIDVASGEKSP